MPELTIGRMAKLYGLHRSTLYEAIDKSRVTAGVNGKGQRVIDLSEMIRVYGEPPGQARQNPTPQADTDPTPSPDALQPLLEELRLLREEYQSGREENRALREEVRELRQAMLRLPAPAQAEPPETALGATKAPPPDDDPHGFRALARALRSGEGD